MAAAYHTTGTFYTSLSQWPFPSKIGVGFLMRIAIIYPHIHIVIGILSLVGWIMALSGYVIMGWVCGLLVGVVFQLAHIVENTEFEDASEQDFHSTDKWVIHPFKTTANFATHHPLITWIFGELTFQVEHHLFSKINHIHYPPIQDIVKKYVKITKWHTMKIKV